MDLKLLNTVVAYVWGLETKVQEYDINALQEPSHNPQTGSTHCSRGSGFWPVYEARGQHPQVALLFNRRLSSEEWKVDAGG